MTVSIKQRLKEKKAKAKVKKFKIANFLNGLLLILCFWIVIPLLFLAKLINSDPASNSYELWLNTKYKDIIPSFLLAIYLMLKGKDVK